MSDPALQSEPVRIIYGFDAYCGWCYGFTPAVHAFARANAHRVAVRVLSGGLFVGEKVQPVSAYPDIPRADARIAGITGAVFGEKYEAALQDGATVLNSQDAATGLVALREQPGVRPLQAAELMQRAWFVDGRSLSEPGVYRDIAEQLDVDADAVVAAYQSSDALQEAQEDMRHLSEMGVHSYPTLLLHTAGAYHSLGDVHSSADDLTEELNRYI